MSGYFSRLATWLGAGEPQLQEKWLAVVSAAALGMLFGGLEALQHFVFRNNPHIFVINKVSSEIFWIAPLVTAGLVVAVAALLTLPGLLLRPWPAVGLAVFSSAFLGAYGLATLANKIHKGAAAILALGVAIATWRLLRRLPIQTLVKRGVPPMLAALVLLWLGLWVGRRVADRVPAGANAPPELPNVLIIVMDTVRGDHLSLDGYPRATTPNIDQWASEGVVFENAWSTSSWTMPAHASLLTGRPASEHGADRNGRLDGRLPVLAEVLAQHGYATGAFIANNIWINPGFGFDRGFQWFSVHTPFSDAARTVWGRKLYSTLENDFHMRNLPVRKTAGAINRDFLDWLGRHQERPFFALLNYFDAHDPYDPPPGFDVRFTGDIPDNRPEKTKYRSRINAYDGLIAYMDTQVGELRRALEHRDRLKRTIVMVTSDHGEGLGDHNQPQHGKDLHRSVARVPLIVTGPGVDGGTRFRGAVSLQQIPATVVALLGLPSPSPFPGASLLNLDAADGSGAPPVLSTLRQVNGDVAARSLATSRWHYIWNASPQLGEELYDLSRDPRELENLAGSPSAEVRAVLMDFRRRLVEIFPDLVISDDAVSSR